MFVVIDRTNMRVLYKVRSFPVMMNLNEIEIGNYSIACIPLELVYVREFTDFELSRLYQSITGQRMVNVWSDAIILATLAALEARPEDEINPILVNKQAEFAYSHPEDEDGTTCYYRYLPGAVRPERILDLRVARPGPPTTIDPVALAGLPNTNAMRAPRALPEPAPAPVPSAPTHVPRPETAPGGQKVATRGASVTVFAVADEMWEAAGKPMDPTVVLTLRREIMAALETDYAIKKTTSSTALGTWQKLRLT